MLVKATKEDIPILLKFETEGTNKFYSGYTTEEDIKKYLVESTVFLIKKNNTFVGNISFEKKKDGEAYIDGLTVTKNYQRQGLAKSAMEELLVYLKDNGYKKVSLVAHPYNNVVLIIYLKLGFTIIEWIDNYFGDNEPRLKMIKNI